MVYLLKNSDFPWLLNNQMVIFEGSRSHEITGRLRLLIPSSGGLEMALCMGHNHSQLPQFSEIPGVTSHLYHFIYIHLDVYPSFGI